MVALLTSKPAGAADNGPIPCDARATLPLLRMRGLLATIEAMAIMAAGNMLTVARMKALGELVGDGVDDATPAGRAASALGLLAEVCARYRNTTGNDGLELAHAAIARVFGDHLAGVVITPLRGLVTEIAIDLRLDGDPGETLTPTITPEERRAACMALAEHGLSLPVYAGVGAALDDFASSVTETALARLKSALWGAVRAGLSRDDLQGTLDAWSVGTGGPSFDINFTYE